MSEGGAETMVRGAYGRTFGSGHGKDVLTHLCAIYHIRTTNFTGNATKDAFNEGQRSVVLHILEQIDPLPEGLPEADKFAYLAELYGKNFLRSD